MTVFIGFFLSVLLMMDRRALATSFLDSVDLLDMDLQPEGSCGGLATNLAAHLPTKPPMSIQSHQSHYLATNLSIYCQ